MQFFSTNRQSPETNFEDAIFQGLPPDNGLYMPEIIPVLPETFWKNCDKLTFNEIAFEVSKAFIGDLIDENTLKSILEQAYDFDAPLVKLDENIYCLELFHGSSMAFKDFGARFMAGVMSYFLKKSNNRINILVATSGDTGGAVAQGFFGKENITVTILYPKGKVSELQEKQLTTLGGNVTALEIDGTFDDCQALVKQAFLDQELKEKFGLASANSINIARLIPQAFYYLYAFSRIKSQNKELVFSVPSGNFGNLTAGLIAMKMGMPVKQFIAATNLNKVVPEYLLSGTYKAISPSIATISNAMDVGNPSNFPRMLEIFDKDLVKMQKQICGKYYDDNQTRAGIKELEKDKKYITCPHSAIAYLGLKDYFIENKSDAIGIFLSTAHYSKFLPDMEDTLGYLPEIPERLKSLLDKTKNSEQLTTNYSEFKDFLLKNLK
ncbi:MAG: threonine synthase [Cytophagaceae bacterium]|nr:threonine synthase [Cytophagaceae bacterium]